jgi:dihydroxy-acid dehydratase
MEAMTSLKTRLPSRHVTEGPERAPHRSCCEAMGLADEQIHQPSVCGPRFSSTMATVAEAIGLALPCLAGAPAPCEFRDRFCVAAGEQVLDLVKLNLHPRAIATRKSLENAATAVAASGGSTNAALHPPANAHECGIAFDLFDVTEVFKRTPFIADLKPGGQYIAKDLLEDESIPLLMKMLLDNGFLHGECLTVTEFSVAENLHRVKRNPDQEAVRPANRPLTVPGGVVGLSGNLAPDGASVKVAGLGNLKLTGAARCFDGEEACVEAVKDRACRDGDVRVIRYEGPKGGLGMREMLATTAALHGQGAGGRVASEAAVGGPIGLLRDGDIIAIDADQRALSVQLSEAELENGRAAWQQREPASGSGYLWKYAGQVGPARHGAVTHPGGLAEKKCYADI